MNEDDDKIELDEPVEDENTVMKIQYLSEETIGEDKPSDEARSEDGLGEEDSNEATEVVKVVSQEDEEKGKEDSEESTGEAPT